MYVHEYCYCFELPRGVFFVALPHRGKCVLSFRGNECKNRPAVGFHHLLIFSLCVSFFLSRPNAAGINSVLISSSRLVQCPDRALFRDRAERMKRAAQHLHPSIRPSLCFSACVYSVCAVRTLFSRSGRKKAVCSAPLFLSFFLSFFLCSSLSLFRGGRDEEAKDGDGRSAAETKD